MTKYRVTRATTTMVTYDVDAASEEAAIGAASGPGKLVGTADLWSAVAVSTGTSPPVKALPDGFGMYLRRITGGAAEAAAAVERCRRAGADWVALMVEATDGYVVPLEVTETYARAFHEAGFAVYVWTFPGDKRAATAAGSSEAATLALNYMHATNALGVIADIEAPYKGKPETLSVLLNGIRDGLTGIQVLGVACYPVPSMHPTMPWDVMKVADFGSPMFYETAQNQALVDKGMREWAAIVPSTIPVLDGWSGSGAAGAARLRTDITTVCGPPLNASVDAASIWSEAQMDDAKRVVTSEMSDAYGWPRVS
jgi:hypothetical protein